MVKGEKSFKTLFTSLSQHELRSGIGSSHNAAPIGSASQPSADCSDGMLCESEWVVSQWNVITVPTGQYVPQCLGNEVSFPHEEPLYSRPLSTFVVLLSVLPLRQHEVQTHKRCSS